MQFSFEKKDILHQGPWFRVRNDDKLATYPELKDIVMEGCLTLIVCETTGLWTGAMLLILQDIYYETGIDKHITQSERAMRPAASCMRQKNYTELVKFRD